jgi:hypothetical protein
MLLAPHQRDAIVDDAVRLIETHVGSRGGLRGISLKTGLAMLKTAKPGILDRAVQRLLPDFLAALEPFHAEFRQSAHQAAHRSADRDFSLFLQKRGPRVAAALLSVADTRVRQASHGVQATYTRLRGSAESEVDAIVPALARLISAYLD